MRSVKYGLLFAVTLLVDLSTKVFLAPHLEPIYNPGVALSLLAKEPWAPYALLVLNLLVGVILLVGVFFQSASNAILKIFQWLSHGSSSKLTAICLGATLIASGSLGNALGRLVNVACGAPPYVTDFIRYPGLFTGNFADICITLGAVIFACSAFLGNSSIRTSHQPTLQTYSHRTDSEADSEASS